MTLPRPATAAITVLVALAVGLAVAPVPVTAAVDDEQWWHTQWRMDDVWSITDGSGSTVAVIDFGVDASIPELAGAVLPGLDFRDADGDGRVDYDADEGGHGTAVASLIAGNGSGSGVLGVAPGASILPVARADTDFDEEVEDLAQAVRWTVDEGADVINMSFRLVTTQCPPALADAVRYAIDRDVLLVASAGNHAGAGADLPLNCPGVLAVGANDSQLEPWENTARGEFVDVSAPGVGIPVVGAGGRAWAADGTSGSAALVSGVIALLRSQFPDASAEEILARIFGTVRDINTPGKDDATGYGVVRPYHALTEDVAQDAPNPVFDALAVAPEPTAAAPVPPVEQPPLPSHQDQGVSAAVAGLLAFGVVLVVVLAVALLLLARSRRRPSGSDDEEAPVVAP